MALLWLLLIIVGFAASPFISFLGPESIFLSYGGYIGLFLLLIIPIASIILWVTRYFRSYDIHRNIKWGLFTTWVFSLVFVIMMGISIADEHKSYGQISSIETYHFSEDVLDIKMKALVDDEDLFTLQLGDVAYRNPDFILNGPQISILKSDNDQLRIEKIFHARGQNQKKVASNTSHIHHSIRLDQEVLMIDDHISISKYDKFRNQHLDIHIYIPEGQKFQLDRSAAHRTHSVHNIDADHSTDQLDGKIWIMTAEGIR